MEKYISKTGYVRNIETNECYEGIIFLGKFDKPENYESITKEEYEEFLKSKEIELRGDIENANIN